MTLKSFRASLGAVACALACAMAFNAHAALFEDDDARKAILELRQRLDASATELRRSGDETAQLRRSLLELSSQIDQLRGELARMRGQDEQFGRELAEVQRMQKDLSQGVNDRLSRFEPSKVSVDGREFVADPAEKQEFDAALAVLRKGEFAPAQAAFTNFLKRYPQSGYKAPALFWLGNAQYALRNYRDALVNFRALVAADPEHVRAPEAVLAVANCQVELKDVKAARKTLEDLIKAYPQSEAASVAKERLTRLK
ncbi:tol-pal system protein YbgF [Polaromonas sp.]|jgi:tol-pal system protein YbgF|uniref:tol-pal system protein YbgF n=1 Tax=Polaromonas sp. TaxID=1869339 RepID=UPI0037C5EE00